MLRPETGSDWVHERTGLLVEQRENGETDGIRLKSIIRKTREQMCSVKDVYMLIEYL